VQGPNSSLHLNVKILVIGLRGTGKTQLIRSLLAMGSSGSGSSSAASLPLDAFSGATKRVEVSQGQVLGVTLTMIDTPGLTASAAGAAANAAVLRKLRKAFQQHEPDLVLYVDRWVMVWYVCPVDLQLTGLLGACCLAWEYAFLVFVYLLLLLPLVCLTKKLTSHHVPAHD
jgi:hypothetical protein